MTTTTIMIRGSVRITLYARHADELGYPNRSAEHLVWQAVAGLPEGALVVVDLGPTRHASSGMVAQLRQLPPGTTLTIEGRSAAVVREWLAALRSGVA